MNNPQTNISSTKTTAPTQGDSNKLLSVLALATGAIAMPQTGVAEIVYTDFSGSPQSVGFLGGTTNYMFDLPGTVQFGFQRYQSTVVTTFVSLTYRYRWVTGGQQGGTVPAGVRGTSYGSPVVLSSGATWSAGAGSLFYNVLMGSASTYNQYPLSGYDNKYLSWAFADTTQGGDVLYGWIKVRLDITHPTGPNVTIYGYAYDNTPGVKPLAGQVPEPNSGALLILGALALGSRGLRKWRQARTSASND